MNIHVAPMQTSSSAVSDPALPRPKLRIRALGKRYGDFEALRPTDLDVAEGEFLTVLGPSGSGKTTLLQIICGLVEPSSGSLEIDGRDETHTPAHRRGIGVVFQSYALFPHLTVAENVAFPLQMRRMPAAELREKVRANLAMVGLDALRDRFPRELSGGQQQRVALARCFVYAPAVILMDEPLGALDRKLREAMQIELKRLHRETGATIVFVTHDQEEALAMSDRICLMNAGGIEQLGTPEEIYEHPATLFAADFIGISNMLQGRADDAGVLITQDGALPLPLLLPGPAALGRAGALIIRPEHIEIDNPHAAFLTGTVTETVYGGSEIRLILTLNSGAILTARRSPSLGAIAMGARVSIGWDTARSRFLHA